VKQQQQGQQQQRFSRVELVLPPPSADPRGAGHLSGAVRKALGRLLAACGLPGDLRVRPLLRWLLLGLLR
jgi:hypothetical protein